MSKSLHVRVALLCDGGFASLVTLTAKYASGTGSRSRKPVEAASPLAVAVKSRIHKRSYAKIFQEQLSFLTFGMGTLL